MHAFAIALGLPEVTSERLAGALEGVGRQFGLDAGTAWQAASPSGALQAAGLHHGESALPRRYIHRSRGMITLFDGLPVDPGGRHPAYDAEQMAAGWEGWAAGLEGQFCAARVDLERDQVEFRLDTLGLVPVFIMRSAGGTLASNSVQVIRELLSPTAADPLGVSTMLGLGWACDRHTLLADVSALRGGAAHTIGRDGIATAEFFGPDCIDRRAGARTGPDELADYMATMIESALRDVRPVHCAVTAGRDTRLLLAFMRSRALSGDFYTIGRPTDGDVRWAERLARDFRFAHRTVDPDSGAELDWGEIAASFLAQTDGLSNLGQLVDFAEEIGSPERIGVKLSGVGAEIGRAGPGDTPISAANVPLLGGSLRLQTRLLSMKADGFRGLMTPTAEGLLDRSITDFAERRMQEGWHVNELAEQFFVFERVACHGATGPRRAAHADDFFSPFCSRRYAEYCLALSPQQRYVEVPYHQLLSRLSPELYEYPFERPLRPPLPWRAAPRAVGRLGRVFAGRYGARRRGVALDGGRPPFVFEWFEQQLEVIRELLGSAGDSPLWEFVARRPVEELLSAPPAERYPQLEGLLRVVTVFWYFHGPTPA